MESSLKVHIFVGEYEVLINGTVKLDNTGFSKGNYDMPTVVDAVKLRIDNYRQKFGFTLKAFEKSVNYIFYQNEDALVW